MNKTSERISALKIDREAAAPSGGSRLWLLIPSAIIVVALGWWFVLRPGAGAVPVETDTARRPPSIAAASSVLDASGYVVARRQATVSSKLTGKVEEVLVEEGMRVEKDQSLRASTTRRNRRRLLLPRRRRAPRWRHLPKSKRNCVPQGSSETGCGTSRNVN